MGSLSIFHFLIVILVLAILYQSSGGLTLSGFPNHL
jgi:hypothetical protein